MDVREENHAVPMHSIYDKNGTLQFRMKIKEMKSGCADTHLHNYDEMKIVRIRSGSCIWNINGRDYDIRTGDLILMNRLDFRFIRAITSAEPLIVCQLCFYPSALYPNHHTAQFFFRRPDAFSNQFKNGEMTTERLSADFDAICREIEEDQPYRDEMILNRLAHMVLLLSRTFPCSEERAALLADHSDVVADTITYIRENPQEDLSLTALAARASMSGTHFSRTFKAYSGIGLREYVTRSRVIRVIALMQSNPQSNIVDLAFACGFNTSSGFYRAFESVTGTSPKAFLRSLTNPER